MAEWSSDAAEYLDGYLKQVSVLVRQQGDDPEDVVAGLRDHISNEVESDGVTMVTIERLLQVLSELGTPEQVANLDPLTLGSTGAVASPAKSSNSQRTLWACCAVAVLVPFIAMIFLALIAANFVGHIEVEPNQTPDVQDWGRVLP